MEAERHRRGWTQVQLAAKSGLTQAEISLMENRRLVPVPERLERLVTLLGVTADVLFDEVRDPRPSK